MSQKAARVAATTDDKEKRQTDSPVKDMKKKMAAAQEKEKIEKQNGDKKERTDKHNGEKSQEKKVHEKKVHEKKEKKDKEDKEDVSKGEKSKPDDKPQSEPTQNGKPNGVSDVTISSNGADTNGVSVSDDNDDVTTVDDAENDELFPELTYDDNSDGDTFDTDVASRSFTRRSQAKPTRTPETPNPAADKDVANDMAKPTRTPETPNSAADKDVVNDTGKETKLLKLKDDPSSAERKLRSTDSPKKTDKTSEGVENGGKLMEPIVLVEDCEGMQEGDSRKPDTNFSKSRVKVSPYRRSNRLADQTNTSVTANYTGNNTTMEMDITESSFNQSEDRDNSPSFDISSLRNIRGRRSYKQLKELNLKSLNASRVSRAQKAGIPSPSPRPTGTVVGRKRKPDSTPDSNPEPEQEITHSAPLSKRLRVFWPFTVSSDTQVCARRNAPIVGINSDLPMSAPIASVEPYDPETIKPEQLEQIDPCEIAEPTVAASNEKRCVVM